MRKKNLNPWILAVLLCASPVASPFASAEVEVGQCDGRLIRSESGLSLGGRNGNCISNEHNAVFQLGSGGFFAAGRSATILAEAAAKDVRFRALPPTKPKMAELRDATGFLMGGFSELLPDSGIFMTDRHVLQSQSRDLVKNGFASVGADLDDYVFFEVQKSGSSEPFDVILAIPKGDEDEILEDSNQPSSCNCEYDGARILRALEEFRSVMPGDLYFTHQFGTAGTKETQQQGTGLVTRTTGTPIVERFFLDDDESNHSTARSSGGLVYLAPKPTEVRMGLTPIEWKIGGIIECQVKTRVSRSGVVVPGGTQVIPISVLLDQGKFKRVSLEKILNEPRKQDPNCPPIDGRGGGMR